MKEVILKSAIENDEFTQYVYDAFDIQNTEETAVRVRYDLSEANNFEWNIGVVFGSSGSGKTTILKELGELAPSEFDPNKPLISNFDWLEPSEAAKLLTSMGLSSIPTWLRPYRFLSNGEQYRAELAYKVGKAKEGDTILIDEYTSVVDRDVAKAMSFALQKYVRRTNKKIVLASCHYDIMEWLMPDWTCAPQKGGVLERGDWLRHGRPSIKLQVSRVEASAWDIFKEHHYLTDKLNNSAQCLLFEWGAKAVAIACVLNTPRKNMGEAMAISRLVVLPDFQGLGIGSSIADFVGGIYTNRGNRMFIKTVNPALGEYFNASTNWRGTVNNGKGKPESSFDTLRYKNRVTRVSYSHEFQGAPISGHEYLLYPIKDMRENRKLF